MESNRWLLIAFLAGGILIGAAAYGVGVSQGAAHAVAVANADRVDHYWGDWGYGWRYGWGFPFGPIIAVFFWFWVLRMVFWGPWWGWRRRRRYWDSYYDDPRWFDEWHRRAHEREERAGKSEV